MKYSDPIDQAAQLSEMYTDIAVNVSTEASVAHGVEAPSNST